MAAVTLLDGAVVSFAGEGGRIDPFANWGEIDPQLVEELDRWDGSASISRPFWQNIIAKAKQDRASYLRSLSRTLRELGIDPNRRSGDPAPSFQDFWNQQFERVTETFVRRIGRDQKIGNLWDSCLRRGIGGLLSNRSVRLGVGALVTLMYCQFFNAGQQRPQPREGDAADLRHAIGASAAEMFVTRDQSLLKRLSRIPMSDGFKVLYLDQFLTYLSGPSSQPDGV